ncbi:MAG: serine hydrolase, partial [Erythrobacter sp.]
SPRSTRLIRDILAETRSGPRRLKAGAPEGWRVQHKTGTGQFYDGEQSGYNDVGIVTAPDGSDYAIAVMIGRTRESYAARMAMMQAVTRATAEFHRTRGEEDAGDGEQGDGEQGDGTV